MAERALSMFDTAAAPRVDENRTEPRGAIARLAILHAEAEETSRLANLLGRSVQAALGLPAMAALTIGLSAGAMAPTIAWSVLVIAASLAIAKSYATAIGQPFERAVLHAFAQDLSAVLLYAGFAWGAGAFLVLPAGAPIGAALVFAAAPALLVALLLRERNAVLLFLAPVAALTSFACVLQPFAGGSLDAALVLIACAIVAGAMIVADRREAQMRAGLLPAGLHGA